MEKREISGVERKANISILCCDNRYHGILCIIACRVSPCHGTSTRENTILRILTKALESMDSEFLALINARERLNFSFLSCQIFPEHQSRSILSSFKSILQ